MATYGLQVPDFAWALADPASVSARLRAVGAAADRSGFSSLWVMDHFFQLPPLGGASAPMLEAYTLLGWLAGATERVRLGALVTGVTYRNPAMLAKEITTLDVLSGGRAIAGIGAAWHEGEHAAYGWTFPPIGERFERLEDAVAILRLMFRDEAPTFSGTHHRIESASNVPRPVQPGGPEIMIGGSGEQKTLRIVARLADSCNVSGDVATVRRRMQLLDGYCTEADRDPATLRRTRLGSLVLCADDREASAVKEMLVSSGLDVGPIVIGTRSECADGVRALTDAGLDELIFNLPGLVSVEQIDAAGDLLREACA